VIVDSRGRRCPLPVIDLAKAIRDVAEGEIVTVLADDPAAATDIPAWCRMRGHDYLGAEQTDDRTGYLVRKVGP
jgi:tRNA 2-thiouridine synthesizing protein A